MADGANPYDAIARADAERRRAEKEKADREAAASKGQPVVAVDPAVAKRIEDERFQRQLDEAAFRLKADKLTPVETAEDVVHSAATGVGRGVASAPGAPFDIFRLGNLARAYADAKINPWADEKYKGKKWEDVLALQDEERRKGERGIPGLKELMPSPETAAKWGGDAWIKSAATVAPELEYKPQSRTGRAVQLGGEVVGGGLLDPAIAAARAAPTVARTFTRQALEDLSRNYARNAPRQLAAGGAVAGTSAVTDNPVALAAAGVGGNAAAQRFSRENAAVREAFAKAGGGNATQAQLDAAIALVDEARAAGLRLTPANALDHVTQGRTRMSELQRVAESSGAPALQEYYSGAPGTVRAAGEQVLDQITPPSPTPSTIGPRVQQAASETVRGAIDDVNRATRPQYDVFEQRQAVPGELQRLMQDPAFADAYHRVMTSSDYADHRQGLAPDSAGIIDLVRRDMETRQTNLQSPAGEVEVSMNPTRAAGLQGPINRAQEVASEASTPGGGPTLPGIPTPLEEAQRQQAILREQNVAPLQAGPEGRIASQGPDARTETVAATMFPKTPLEGSADEVRRAVTSIAGRDELAARQLVRNHLGTQLAQATSLNIPGEPYTSGAGFAKNVAGNPQRRENLDAALRSLPNGGVTADAFGRMLDIFEAMGKRQHPGSKTAFNEKDLADLKKAGWDEAAIKMIAGGGLKWPEIVKDRIESWRLGRNVDEIAAILTDPNRAGDFRALAATRPGSVASLRALGYTFAALGRPVLRQPENEPNINYQRAR